MLVGFDHLYRIRDLYFPHVGAENHAGGGPCRFGVWAKLPRPAGGERRRNRLFWTDEGWHIDLRYEPDSLATRATLRHDDLQVELRCSDVVDFHRALLVRRIDVKNLTPDEREVRLFSHHLLHMYGTNVGDTAYYDPQLRSLIHYRKQRYIMCCFYVNGEPQIDEYATGTAGFHGAEGTWRDAEDGHLGGNSIAQGAVDSTMMCRLGLPGGGVTTVYLVLGCGTHIDDMDQLHQFLHRESPQGVIDRNVAYWRLWLTANRVDLDQTTPRVPEKVEQLYKRSLLIVRTQIDNNGAVIAANDSDYLHFARDTYSYLWPRDGALVADALDGAGFPHVTRAFLSLCADIINPRGYFLHKYNPDGSLASSWHPWVALNKPQLPIQEDETALVVWSAWRHFVRYRDIEFVRPLWMRLVRPAADFMERFRDPDTHLPLPSYDLWEERWGVHAFTVATVHAGLVAAQRFAESFGDKRRAKRYERAAAELREAFCRIMWSKEHNRFLRRVVALDHDRTAAFVEDVRVGRRAGGEAEEVLASLDEKGPRQSRPAKVAMEEDATVDASLYAIFAMGLLPPDDPRVAATMQAVEDKLRIKRGIGGVARYENDSYHQIVRDDPAVPGNPWFICTLWLAEWYIARATTVEQLGEAMPLLEWCADRALPSGVLAEQVHPLSGAPMSVSPLTWSHATVVSTVVKYVRKQEQLRGAEPRGAFTERPRRAGTGLPVPTDELSRIQ
jgi:GH15 family glucan-1,4-alpha-glucosidase